MSAEQLITKHLDIWTSAHKTRSSAGRGSSSKLDLYGIKKLRELILELAVRGKLVPQDPNDEPASELLAKINETRRKLVIQGQIKKQKALPPVENHEKTFEIPNGWIWERLTNIFDVRDGTHDTPKYVENGVPLVTSKNLSSGVLDLSDVKLISAEDHFKISERSKVDRFDILFAMIGSIGNPVLVDTDTEFSIKNVALFKYYDVELSDPSFLLLYLKYATVKFKEQASGAVQSFVSLGQVRNFPIALPPLAEQMRIVSKVEELMAFCDQLEQAQTDSIDAHAKLVEALLTTLTDSKDHQELHANWQRIAEHFDTLFTTEESIDQLKQTILQLAVMGKLVPQDPSDEPANELLKKIAAEKAQLIKDGKIKKEKPLPEITDEEKPFELPFGWAWVRLISISDVGTGATPSRTDSSFYEPAEVNWVTSGETGNAYIKETQEKISWKAVKETNVSVYPPGTLIIAMYGQGKTRGQISELLIEAGTNQACAAIRLVCSEATHRKFIKLFFIKSYDEIREHSAGGAQPNLNVGKISATVLPVPPIQEQKRIVSKIDELFAYIDAIKFEISKNECLKIKLSNCLVEFKNQ